MAQFAGTVDNIIPDHGQRRDGERAGTDHQLPARNCGCAQRQQSFGAHVGGDEAGPRQQCELCSGQRAGRYGKRRFFGVEFIEAGVPSVFFIIGAAMLAKYKAENKPVPVNRSPYFAPVPEPTIRIGVEVLTLAVLTKVSAVELHEAA